MTSAVQLAVAQQEQVIAAPAPLFVRACPGAGKTHVIVSRHLRGPANTLRHGRALLSFTRAAAAQMRRRCYREGRPDTTEFPHYIGTLDAFIWDLLVEPNLPSNTRLQRIDSWDRVEAEVKLDRTVPLSAFTFQRDYRTGQETIRKDLLKPRHRAQIEASKYAWRVWAKKAFDTRRAQYKAGYATGHEARLLALCYLDRGETVTGPLRSRFAEIIVDEVQDCSVTDLEILQRLHTADIPMVAVGDPDQMIYGWRDADPGRLEIFERSLGSTLNLVGNWRSSVTVCRLASTLRTGDRAPDVAVRPPKAEHPTLLLPTQFSTSEQARHSRTQSPVIEAFLAHADRRGINPSDCLVTAYARIDLPTPGRRQPANQVTLLARAWHVIQSGTADPEALDHACLVASRFLLRYWYPDQPANGSLQARCKTAGINYGELGRHAYAFLNSLPVPHPDWAKDVNTRAKAWPRPLTAAPIGSKGQLRAKLDDTAPWTEPSQCRIDNIAQVKGDEHAGVLLLITPEDADTRWIHGDPETDELLRNWYVAVTRAESFVALAVRDRHVTAISSHLAAAGVPIVIDDDGQ
ncbi:ATP-dependent helicase [Nocardia cyriacigeorgica]|uniref:ATP-dependent helicase n=1 Tax=Nocardia cyriacigeorgica TaxID=135487 RepID=A0A6P1CMY0_9NOCA|nr:UvrD-helicase domain-containing protein [Nocardia cyriacigeorgica]NEW32704.1 ATP-dependent helicase [Nocardia cyriacigeorgica]